MFFHHFNILMLIAINSGGFKMVSAPMVTANTDFRYPFSSHRALLIGYQSIEIVFVATNINRAALSTVFSYVFLNFRQFFPLTYSLSPLSVRIMYALELTSIRTSFQFWSWRLFIRFTSFHSLSICVRPSVYNQLRLWREWWITTVTQNMYILSDTRRHRRLPIGPLENVNFANE